ncbi:metallophosphoesterase family protein [Sinirhodobacter sp. HNIBRBA609]|nr:metallophosphoesterase family protein [Sinirhodobacter sp. HNIBRBA609]
MRIYAIGDIHGQLDRLKAAHALIERDRRQTGDADARVVHVGDLVDRGPRSAGVIDYLMQGQADGRPWEVLRGNHDRMFLGFLDDPYYHDPMLRFGIEWLHPRVGGCTTLESYGVANAEDRPLDQVHRDAVAAVPARHREWLAALPIRLRSERAFFAHAGVRPGVDLDAQVEDDLLWIRREFLDDRRDHGVLVVHGHTAIDEVTHYGNRINLDTSAGYGGPVSAVVIEGDEVWLLSESGRVPPAAG